MTKQCCKCLRPESSVDLRVRWDDGAYGGFPVVTCRTCHEREMQERRNEGRRFGYRPATPSWEKLER